METCMSETEPFRAVLRRRVRSAALIEAIRNGSVATWAHFNPHGEFDFSGERMVYSIGLTPPQKPGLE
jgi:hypothetical protein